MLSSKNLSRRLRRFAFPVLLAGLACAPLWAQSGSGSAQSDASAAQPPAASVSVPTAPVGTTYDANSGSFQQTDARTSPLTGESYKIGADDILSINVWHEPEVSRNVPVRPDGKISLPLVGDVQAAGLTPTELQQELQTRFSKYLTDPSVSVIVAEIRSQRINVLGEVFRPGTYPLIPPMNLIDAIANAGGLKEFAKASKIYILRTLPDGQTEHIKVQYKNLLKGKRGSKDILLQTRDTVVVP